MINRPAGHLWSANYILLAVGNLMMAMGFYFLIPTLPIYVVEVLQAKTSDVGFILAAYTISALIIRPFTGIALDTWGRKWIYILSFLIFSLTLLLYPMITTFALLLLVRFFHGFSWGATTTSGMTVVVDVIPPPKRGRGIGYFGISFTLAMALAPVIALSVLDAWGYYSMFHLAATISLAGFLLILFVRFPIFQPSSERFRWTWKRFIEPRAVPISIPYALYGISYGGIVSFITLFDKEAGYAKTGTFFLILAAGVTATRLFAGNVFDARGPRMLMLAGFALTITGFLLISVWTTLHGFLISAGFIGLGAGILMPTLQTMVNNVVPVQRRGAANATLITAFDLGIGLGSLALGYLSEWAGFRIMYLTCMVILIIGTLHFNYHVDRFYRKYQEPLS